MLYNTNIDKISKSGAIILDNIAQLPQVPIIKGLKGQKNPKTPLERKAKAKDYTQIINGPLCYLDSPNHKMYERAYHCNDVLRYDKITDKITARYCNSRTCIICNKIRTRKLILGYYQPLVDLAINEPDKKLEFVTLTIPNCKKDDLDYVRENMIKNISNIIRNLNEYKHLDISGIRKFEVTYNDKEDTYHPHIHIIVNKNSGQLIIDEWLKRYPTAAHWCQQTKKADTGSLLELFKYSTKFLIKDNKTRKQKIYIHAIDTIMTCLKNKRIIQPFGQLKKLEDKISEEVEELISEKVDEMYAIEKNAIIGWDINERNYFLQYVDYRMSQRSKKTRCSYMLLDNEKKQLTFYKPPDENKFDIYY